MNIKYLLAATILAAISLTSCEDILNNPTSTEIAYEIEGEWTVDESSDLFKSAMQGYHAYIRISDFDSTKVYIENFYGLGKDNPPIAQVIGYNISLSPNQTLSGGFTLTSGSGTINKNLKEIQWNYSIDDGSGEPDNVKATYTLIY